MEPLFAGLISGTSMDAVDAALVRFSDGGPQLLAAHEEPMPADLRGPLQELDRADALPADRLFALDAAMGRTFAGAALRLVATAGLEPAAIRAIGCHGQSVRHRPHLPSPYTLQLGNPNLIAELTGITVVADFRGRDLAAGGQGAPLAPAFHAAFFRSPDETRCVVNIGGIANLTILPGAAERPVAGFDSGPGNTLLDLNARRHLGRPFDRDGEWARSGRPDMALLERMMGDPYFAACPPKSTGPDHFGPRWLDRALAARGAPVRPEDLQATLLELTAQTIARAIADTVPDARRVLLCGGGASNAALAGTLRDLLGGRPVETTAVLGVDPNLLEAIGFAWLARQTLLGLPGNVPQATGARGPRILGGIYQA